MKELIIKNRKLLNHDLKDIDKRKFYSPALFGNYQVAKSVIHRYVRGRVLDAGCGDMPYKNIILKVASSYDSLDIEKRASGITYIGDIQNMKMIADSQYDSAICFSVLEHAKDPAEAINELHRILKSSGILVLSAPHLSRLHEVPNDFFRFTKYGLSNLFEKAGFKILEINPDGGFFSFFGHQWSTFFVLPFWHIPIIGRLIFFINKWLCVLPCYCLDKIFDKSKLFALGYVCVVQKV